MKSSRWRLRPHDPARILALSREAGVSPLVAQILLNRGVDEPARVRTFLDRRLTALHDPEGLPGAAAAAARIVAAVRDHRKIVIYGDYDVDGVCGTSVLWACLRLAGARHVEYYIPHRVDEGYGLNTEALRKLAREGAELVITVDCGISAVEEARLARTLGLELIVTDHHTIGPELPEADVLVHPRLPGTSYPFAGLCGCGVAFKVAWQVCKGFGDGKKASPHLRDFLVRSIGLVALATIADVMPLDGENRVLVHHGLRGVWDSPTVGLKALLEVSGCRTQRSLTAGAVSFKLAPRINAAGRLDCAKMAVEMLTTDDPDRARELAESLDRCNVERQAVERSIVAEAHALIDAQGGLGDRGAIVLGNAGWHLGVIGIVAGRLAEVYHRPAVVVALGEELGQGSARSIPGFHLYEALRACSRRLTSFGGHSAAAGLRLPRAAFEAFAEEFDAHCRGALGPDQLRKELAIDAEVPLGALSLRVVGEIEALEPFGVGNPQPVLLASDLRVVGDPRPMGDRGQHAQLRVQQGGAVLRAVGWNMAQRVAQEKLRNGVPCALAFQPYINEWNGRRDVQLEIKDFQVGDGVPGLAAGDVVTGGRGP